MHPKLLVQGLVATACALAGLALVPAPVQAADLPAVAINEVESNGDVQDWIELTNTGSSPVAIGGMILRDNANTSTYTITAGTTLPVGGYLAFDVDVKNSPNGVDFGLGSADSARLFLADGTTLVDTYSWTAHANPTYGRCPDGTGAFVTTLASTKAAANSCTPPTSPATALRINEVESSDATPGPDWIELVNTGAGTVDAGGLVLRDNGTADPLTIPAGTSIAPGAYLAFDPVFGLGGGDSARLFGTDGTTLIDSYTWTTHATTTYGRCPNGTGAFVTTLAPTKGAANSCAVALPPVRFNEVESNGDPIGDWAELVNTGSTSVDLSGLKFKDADDTHAFYTIPAGTTLAAGALYVLNEADFGFGLGSPDSVRLFASDGTTLIDSYSWTPHATTTYGRCPSATGAFATTTSATKGTANDCTPPVRVNEVESSGGNPGDWVELINNGTTSLDVSGWIFKDNVDSDVYTLPSGSTIPAGGYLTLDEAQFVFGLGTSDSARLYLADGVTLVDSYAWTAHATTSYGRCPNGTGAFTTTATPTKGTSNVCPGDLVTTPWPGGSDVATADAAGALGGDVSGLAFDATTLYAVNNGTGSLVRLLPGAGGYAIDSTRVLRYPDGTGVPDAEGVALTAAGAAGGVYVATERNNSANGISRPSILRYDVSGSGSPLSATDEWALAADLPSVAANAGLEAIAWVPDSALVAAGFRTDAGALYDPAAYAGHGSGLFFVGLEAIGRIYGYALGAGGSYTRVTSFASGFPGVMDLEWDPERSSLWAVCDDTCNGRSTLHQVGGDGRFAISQAYERPAAMPNLNNEGFAIAPQSQCVGGTKPVVWSDDSNTGGHALRAGTISCTAPPASSVAGVVSAPAGPFPGACVYLYTSRSAPAASYGSCTQADGSYYLAGVTAGTYEVAVADPSGTYRTIWRATPLVVGGIVTGVDLVLTGRNPGAVAGTVTTTQGGGALSNVCAYLYPHGDATAAAYATCTLADGTFGLYDVAAGSYDLAFFDPAGVHPTRWHTGSPGGAPSQAGAVALTVTGGATRTADIALSPVTAGTVSGTVTRGTNPATAAAGVCVYLYTSPAGPAAYGTCTQSDGTWYLGEVAAGTYRVGFADPAGQLRTQWWTGGDGGATAYAGGANVVVTAGGGATAIDARMIAVAG